MIPFRLTVALVFVVVEVSLLSNPVTTFSQDSSSETGESYARAFRELDGQYSTHLATGQKLITERQETLKRLAESQVEFAKIMSAKMQSSFQAMMAELEEESLRAEANSILRSIPARPMQTGVNPWRSPQFQMTAQSAAFGRSLKPKLDPIAAKLARFQVMQDLIQHELKTINASGQLVVQRHMDQAKELQRIASDMQKWGVNSRVMFSKYWQLSDAYATKSDVELQQAFEQLDSSSKENPGAVYALTVTLTRLKEYDKALLYIDSLKQVPEISGIVLGLHAEIMVRKGKDREAAALIKKTTSAVSDPAVRIQRAVIFSAVGQHKKAEQEWEALSQMEGYETAGRRGLAWVYGSANSDCRHPKRALENAKLVVQLDSEDWSALIASAIAHSINKEKDKALALAKEAATKTDGDNKLFCESIAKKLEADEEVSWRF